MAANVGAPVPRLVLEIMPLSRHAPPTPHRSRAASPEARAAEARPQVTGAATRFHGTGQPTTSTPVGRGAFGPEAYTILL